MNTTLAAAEAAFEAEFMASERKNSAREAELKTRIDMLDESYQRNPRRMCDAMADIGWNANLAVLRLLRDGTDDAELGRLVREAVRAEIHKTAEWDAEDSMEGNA